jgi:K(+)-stimulated pyrophosphate-energized sodium pump
MQFADPAISSGAKKPDYGRVVDICTRTAQKELVGPGLLGLLAPLTVGLLLGPFALGGFLAGMILVGQLLAVFMANAGGAWDNAKKMIEDGRYGGKGSDAHKASVTGDTVGDPLKDTAGPAINPLVKVVNMVCLLGLSFILANNVVGVRPNAAGLNPVAWAQNLPTNWRVGLAVSVVAIIVMVWSVWQSKRESEAMREIDRELGQETGGGRK